MNYTQLQQAILDDCHASQYAGADVQRFIVQGEALINLHLESYNLLGQLLDANRVSANSPNYNLPARLTHLRYVRINGLPLDKVDETQANRYSTANDPIMYVQRAKQILIAGNPGTGVVIDIDYMGMPEPLSAIAPTNTLLDECQQLYIDAASVYVYTRKENLEMAEAAMQKTISACSQLNRKSKKLLGGAQSAPAYNVNFRSSY